MEKRPAKCPRCGSRVDFDAAAERTLCATCGATLALSRTGDFSGTPFYMSPEQAMSRRMGIDHRTDIFSLGVTLYEMLTLRLPFDGETTQDVLKKILLYEPRDPRKVNALVPRDLAVISMKAMEKKPDGRYQSMEELADDLNRYLSGDVITAKPARVGTRLFKRIKRNPVLSTALGAALLAPLVLLWRRSRRRAGSVR